ncbi:hypothetical protein Mapa_007280 [Marchantia paleacea]|nr:hypothetical protein Mapa_007280 [Marchantia paleacea]
MGSVAIQHRCIAAGYLPRVVHDDHLRGETRSLLRRVVLRVRGHESSLQLLRRYILHVEPHIVTGLSLLHSLVVHLDGHHLRSQSGGGEAHRHSRLEHSSLHSPHRDSSDASDLVHILEWQPQRLVSWPLRLSQIVQSLQKSRSLVPLKVLGPLDHVVSLESGDGHERDVFWIVSHLFQVA